MATQPSTSEKKHITIIGAGIIGATTAYYLTRHPHYNPTIHIITLLEAQDIASGASGKAGGLLALWAYPKCIVPLSFKLHAELAMEHGGREKWGYRSVGCGSVELKGRRVGRDARVLKKGVEGRAEGLRGAHDESIAGETGGVSGDAKGNVSLQKRSEQSFGRLRKVGWPEELDWVAEECVEGYEAMGAGGETAQVHPYWFTRSMVELAEEGGVKVVLGSVTGIEGGDEQEKMVRYTEKESGEEKSVTATDVVVTAGPWTRNVWPGAPISNTRAHSVTIRPSRPVSGYCLFTQLGLPKDFKEGMKSKVKFVTPEIYARPNNELYACGEGDHLVPLPKSTAEVEVDQSRCQDIVDYCAAFSDEMRDGEVLVRQACYLPLVETGGGPLIGPTKTKGVWIASGHTCWGICNSAATGKLMSEFVLDGKAKSANVNSLDPRKWLR